MDGFERRRQQKKDAILNAAFELFKQFGYNKVSIAEIASKASVSQVSIYNFFKSKENLKQELLEKILKEHVNETMNILKSDTPVAVRLERLLKTRIESLKSFSSRFLVEALENNQFFKDYMASEEYRVLINSIYSLIDQGKAEGIFEASISTEAMYSFIEIFQIYLLNNPSFLIKIDNNPQFAGDIFSLFMNAFMKK